MHMRTALVISHSCLRNPYGSVLSRTEHVKLMDVSSRPVYSGLMNSCVLPIAWLEFEIGFDGFLLSQNTNFFLGTSIQTSVDAGSYLYMVQV
jgi:hypothetical protein